MRDESDAVVGVDRADAALRVLESHEWQLRGAAARDVIRRACLLTAGDVLARMSRTETETPWLMSAVEREHITAALLEERGDKTATARRLGITRRSLYRLLEQHGMTDQIRRRSQAAVLAFRKAG